jgi:hypothetical protein
MKIKNDPFPHIIIEDYFTDVEYKLIWREIDFLSSKLKTPSDFSAAQNDDGEYLTDSSGLSLDSTYFDRSVSDILQILVVYHWIAHILIVQCLIFLGYWMRNYFLKSFMILSLMKMSIGNTF